MKSVLFISLILMTIAGELFARQVLNPEQREIYLTGSVPSVSDLGIQYKLGLNDNTLLRFGILHINSNWDKFTPAVSNEYPSSDLMINGGLEVGLEKRFAASENMQVFYGIDLICYAGYSSSRSDNPNLREDMRNLERFTVSPGLGFKSGIILNLKNNFFISAELSPQLLYRYQKLERITGADISTDRRHGFDLNLNTESLRISLIYKWKRST